LKKFLKKKIRKKAMDDSIIAQLLEKKDLPSYKCVFEKIRENSSNLPKELLNFSLYENNILLNNRNYSYTSYESLRATLLFYYLSKNSEGLKRQELTDLIILCLDSSNIRYSQKNAKEWLNHQFSFEKNYFYFDERLTYIRLISKIDFCEKKNKVKKEKIRFTII
jgi:hypothetical protein